MESITNLAQDILDTSAFWTDEACPFHLKLFQADPKLLVIAGANASGKSLFCQFVSSWAHKEKVLPVSISIRERTGAGSNDMSGMRRVMMFGSEEQQSTGATSVGVTQRGFNNVLDRTALLILDEPDMGLSEDYAHAFGRLIANEQAQAVQANPNYKGLLVVTHSRSLVSGICEEGAAPSFLCAGSNLTMAEWLASTQKRSLEDLLKLGDLSHARRRQTQKMLADPK